jgi:hypothetical protein
MPQKEDSHEPDSTRSVHRAVHDPLSEQFFNGFVIKRWIPATFLRALHLKTFKIHLVDWQYLRENSTRLIWLRNPVVGEELLDAQARDSTGNDYLLNL